MPKHFSQIFPKGCFNFWLVHCPSPRRRKRHHTCFRTGLKIITTIDFCCTSMMLFCHVKVRFRSKHWFLQFSLYDTHLASVFVHEQDGERGSGFTHPDTEIQWLILLHIKVTGVNLKPRAHATAGKYLTISSLETRGYSYLGMSDHTIC